MNNDDDNKIYIRCEILYFTRGLSDYKMLEYVVSIECILDKTNTHTNVLIDVSYK